ncbi:oxygenase MpaB family protein [Humibacter albus]|uniref:oxygenase MpaB family protein n=1 Tax=Humibacter albus TaxID=427754 RepID=UPI0003B3ADA0|nr:oxygenase MpaB family protein [Humibacter albus]
MARNREHDPQGIADVGGEWIMLAGGGCAILLQIANPAIGRGVAEHSDFAARPYDRLLGTLTYVTAVACGTADDIQTVRRIVGRAHAPVHGEANDDTDAYSAYDHELQLWVAATLYWTAERVRERVFGPLDARAADRLYREFGAIGTTLQLPPTSWPATRADFEKYWRGAMADLFVLPEAGRVARDLLRAEHAPLWVRAIMPWARLATVALLPDAVRAQLGLVLTPRNRHRYERMMTLFAAIYPRLPMGIRHLVRDRLLRRLRGLRTPA